MEEYTEGLSFYDYFAAATAERRERLLKLKMGGDPDELGFNSVYWRSVRRRLGHNE